MATRRPSVRGAGLHSARTGAPLGTAVCLGSAATGSIINLVANGRLEWPPTHLLGSAATVAGCLALVGPILLRRKELGEIGLGDLIWMTGGLLIWIFDAAALARGETRSLSWASPLSTQSMGLMILAAGLAGWRCRLGQPSWSWTNVTGWMLGIFWVLMAATTLVPARGWGLANR